MTTKSQEIADEITALLRARNPLLWIITREETRVERYLCDAARAAKYRTMAWDIATGFSDENGQPIEGADETRDPDEAMKIVRNNALGDGDPVRGFYIMRDLPVWLAGQQNARTLRGLRNLARDLPMADLPRTQAIAVISPSAEVPAELSDLATVIDWPLPDREEMGELLDTTISDQGAGVEPLNGKREAAVDAAMGLSENKAAACFGRSLVQHKRIDVNVVATEKKRVIAAERLLEWFDPLPGGLDAVGGLQVLKGWLTARQSAYSPEARAYGLPLPKGVLLVGIPGTGKTMAAKATATAWGVPLLKMNLAALKSKFLGESEANIRRVQKVIESAGRCVVWIDEIEKDIAGATTESSDGGASADQLGQMLYWMQERKSAAFIMATANDVSKLPPELLRKGRWDEMFFVDLPTATERSQILLATLKTFGKEAFIISSMDDVVASMAGFTGAEIAAVVPDAMFAAFNDGGRPITSDDLIEAAKNTAPISRTMSARIRGLQEWAAGKCRMASLPEEKKAGDRKRVFDMSA